MAFTTAAFSSTSNMGSETSETRMRCSTGSACHAVTHSCSTSRPSGSSLTPSTSGPTRARWASPVAGSVATFSANAIMTPYMSLSRSQRETCTTSGVAGSSGPPSRTILAWRVTVPVEPPFGKIAGPVSFGGVTRPTALRIDTTVRWSKWMFLTANGSMAGGRTLVLPPAIDPFAGKNIHFDHRTVVSILSAVGLVTPPKDTGPAIFPKGGSTGTVTRQAKIVREGGPLDPATPLVVQVSRWDRLKDMYGVMMAFAEKVTTDPATGEAHLALVGPDVEGERDDPEGLEVLQECMTAWHALPVEQRKRVSLVSLAMFDVDENAAVVNAIQRHASIVTQKSLAEGFGLTVSEAMWKARPVVASSVGGILDQISSGQNGVLVAPEDLDAFAAALTRLLTDAAESRRLGQAARERVLDQFLPDRQLTQWAQLFVAMTTAGRAAG